MKADMPAFLQAYLVLVGLESCEVIQQDQPQILKD